MGLLCGLKEQIIKKKICTPFKLFYGLHPRAPTDVIPFTITLKSQ
jgi:hypothetical protein